MEDSEQRKKRLKKMRQINKSADDPFSKTSIASSHQVVVLIQVLVEGEVGASGRTPEDRSPVSGRGSGQGRSSRGHWSNKDRSSGPEQFYKSSMIEDPWKFLKPVIWNAVTASFYIAPTPENSKSRTSKSVSTKWEGSSAAPVKFSSEPSLAEYLAAESADKE